MYSSSSISDAKRIPFIWGTQALQVNVTLVATLLDCLLENWACDIVSDYVVGELTNLVSGHIADMYVVLSGFVAVLTSASCTSCFAL